MAATSASPETLVDRYRAVLPDLRRSCSVRRDEPARPGEMTARPGGMRSRSSWRAGADFCQAISGTRRCATASTNSPTSSTLTPACLAPAALTVPACSRLRSIAS
jgi:hypothetical protein